MDLASSFISVKKVKSETDFSVCLICQKSGKLVGKSTANSYETLLCFIRDRAGFGEADFISVDFRLADETTATLDSTGTSWHRDCYICHKQKRDAARERYERALYLEDSSVHRRPVGRPEKMIQVPEISQDLPIPAKLTRSSLESYNKNLCFFCQTDKSQTLHETASHGARIRLRQAVEQGNDDKLRIRLNTAFNSDAASTIGVKYHDLCWRYNVDRLHTNMQKLSPQENLESPLTVDNNENKQTNHSNISPNLLDENMAIVAADMEFLSLPELLLHEGSLLRMADLHKKYIDIRTANGVSKPEYRRIFLKQKIASHVKDIQFGKPKRKNESEYVYTTRTRDEFIRWHKNTTQGRYENIIRRFANFA